LKLTDNMDLLEQHFLQPFQQHVLHPLHHHHVSIPLYNPPPPSFRLLSPNDLFSILSTFIVLLLLGTQIMKRSKKINLRVVLIAHTLVLALGYGFIFYEIFNETLTSNFSIWGNSWSTVGDRVSTTKKMAHFYWVFYVLKAIELFSLIWRVVEKKNVTFMSVFFSVSNLLFSWAVLYYDPSDEAYFPITLHSFTNAIIYTTLLIYHVGKVEVFPLDFWVLHVVQSLVYIAHMGYLAYFYCFYPTCHLVYSFLAYNVIGLLYHLVRTPQPKLKTD